MREKYKKGDEMARKQSVVCDVCGVEKGSTNHWFQIDTNDNGKAMVEIYRADGHEVGEFDLCGETCVMKKVSELIGASK